MAIENPYGATLAPAVAGAQATMIPATIISRNVQAAGGIPFGVAVSQGATDKAVVAGGTAYVGITLLDRSAEGTTTTPDGFGQYDSARIITKGDVWVVATVAVTAGQPVTFSGAGAFSNTGGTTIPNARWDTSTTAAGQLAVVRLG